MKKFYLIILLSLFITNAPCQENKWLYHENSNLFFSNGELNANWLNANLILTKKGCNITLLGKNYQEAKTSIMYHPNKLDGGHMGAIFTIDNKEYYAIIYFANHSRFLIISEVGDNLGLSTPIVLREITYSREYVANKYEGKGNDDENSDAFLQGLLGVLKLVF